MAQNWSKWLQDLESRCIRVTWGDIRWLKEAQRGFYFSLCNQMCLSTDNKQINKTEAQVIFQILDFFFSNFFFNMISILLNHWRSNILQVDYLCTMKYNYRHGFTKWRVDWVHLRNDTTGWLNTLLSFKPKKICAPVRPCTSVQDESPLPSPSSSGFCQQFLKNPRSWFHTGVDSRFRMHTDIPINNKDANRESSSPSCLFSSSSSQTLFPQERRMRALTPTMGLSSPMARDSSRWERLDIKSCH